jgi:UrcA family protein
MKIASRILLLACIAAPAGAAPQDGIVVRRELGVPTATVIVTSADFASTHSRTMLDRRIRGAIESVCGSYAAIEWSQVPQMDGCWSGAWHQANDQLSRARTAKFALVAIAAR